MIALALVASACGGSDSGAVIGSEDGRATLSLQPGSLPEGFSPDDVQLEMIVDEAGEPAAPVVAVQLLPDGLVLAEPATLTVALPEALEVGFMAIHMSGDSIEFLEGDIQIDDDGVFTFQTSVEHFSVVSFYLSPFFETSASATEEQVSVGQIQRVDATITRRTDPISLWFSFISDPFETARLFRFSAPQVPFGFEDPEIVWGTESGAGGPQSFSSVAGLWEPRTHRPRVEVPLVWGSGDGSCGFATTGGHHRDPDRYCASAADRCCDSRR